MKKIFAVLTVVIFTITVAGPVMVSGNNTYTVVTNACLLNKASNDTTGCAKHANKDKKCPHHQEGKKDCPKKCPHEAKKDSTTTTPNK